MDTALQKELYSKTLLFAHGISSGAVVIANTLFIRGLTKDKKTMFQWTVSKCREFPSPMLLRTWKGRTSLITRNELLRFSGDIPEMSLAATTEFFVNRLSNIDKKNLLLTLKSLDGKCIKVGSTCSGTDIIVPVITQTFATLSRLFGVPCLVVAFCFPIVEHAYNSSY